MAFLVEVIRILWDKGLYRQNKWLQMIHDEWFEVWTIWRTGITMKDVDRQIEEMFHESEVDPPVFSEELEGETPLGGKMELRAPWLDEEDS
jgi:hypothetical protein